MDGTKLNNRKRMSFFLTLMLNTGISFSMLTVNSVHTFHPSYVLHPSTKNETIKIEINNMHKYIVIRSITIKTYLSRYAYLGR